MEPEADTRESGAIWQGMDAVTIGALLYDIGLFWERAADPAELLEQERRFCESPANHASFGACTSCSSRFRSPGAMLSAAFINAFVPAAAAAVAASAVLTHPEQPEDPEGPTAESPLARLLATASRFALGQPGDHPEPAASSPQLRSIFQQICLDNDARPARLASSAPHYLPLRTLDLADEQALFPSTTPVADSRAAYRSLWQDFLREATLLKSEFPAGDLRTYSTSLYFLLQKYTWCIPSAGGTAEPDVSLFDRARITSAIAVCLSQGLTEEHGADVLDRQPDQQQFLLIGGDMSGVQDFLYTLTSKGAARGLRARSFFIQLLCDAVAHWTLRQLDLPVTNLIYSGGGNFFILAPRRGDPAFGGLRKKLSTWLLKALHGDLSVIMASEPVAPADLLAFPWRMRDLHGELGAQKRRKFAELDAATIFADVFRERGAGGLEPTCVICWREGASRQLRDGEPEDKICELCASFQEDLGRQLRDAVYLLEWWAEPQLDAPATWDGILARLGCHVHLYQELPSAQLLPPDAQSPALYRLGSADFLPAQPDARLAYGVLLQPNATPRAGEEVADFADLARQAEGVERWAVLRMDVDSLGSIFAEGLGARAGIAQVAALSFLMQLYFQGWVGTLCRRYNTSAQDGKDQVFLIYAGGDDLFVVGAWSALPQLATAIHEDFARFACQNPDIHISGGITLASDIKFPLYQVAQQAKEALDDRAKAFVAADGSEKNAIDFLSGRFRPQTASWPEFALVSERAAVLARLVGTDSTPKALLHNLVSIYEEYFKTTQRATGNGRGQRQPDQQYYGRWMWLTAYQLTRMADAARSPSARNEIIGLRDHLLRKDETGRLAIHTLGLAARWAELRTRGR